MSQMLTHEEQQAMIMFDRLLMAAKDNETVADLLDQTLNVARMIDPRPNDKVIYGPLQRMHFEWQQMKHRMDNLDKKMDQYINSQNRYPGTYTGPTAYPTMTSGTSSMWPSNPGWDLNASSPSIGSIRPLTPSEINSFQDTTKENIEWYEKLETQIEKLKEQMNKAKPE
jgi:hypothetical protein